MSLGTEEGCSDVPLKEGPDDGCSDPSSGAAGQAPHATGQLSHTNPSPSGAVLLQNFVLNSFSPIHSQLRPVESNSSL